MDTGGIGLLRREKANDVIVKAALEQVDLAIEAADVIILVVNVQEGVVPLDREVAAALAPTAANRSSSPSTRWTPTGLEPARVGIRRTGLRQESSRSARFTARASSR